MAQEIGYFENNVTFTEGPFVIVNSSLFGNGWRIECEKIGFEYTVLPDDSVYDFCEKNNRALSVFNKEDATRQCDWLNSLVNDGTIALNKVWHVPSKKLKIYNKRRYRCYWLGKNISTFC